MIDLISTRPGTESQAQACARLLAAVIAKGISDAATKPIRFEKSCGFNINRHANQSIRWIFKPYTTFEVYAKLIGLDPQAVRDVLLSNRKLHQSKYIQNIFSDQDRRIIKLRHTWLINQLESPDKFQAALDLYKERMRENLSNTDDFKELEEEE